MGGQNEEDKPSDSSSLPKEKAAIPPSELALVGLGADLENSSISNPNYRILNILNLH